MSKPLGEKLKEMQLRFEELERKLLDPQTASQGALYAAILKTRGQLAKVIEPYRTWKRARQQVEEAETILAEPEADEDLKRGHKL